RGADSLGGVVALAMAARARARRTRGLSRARRARISARHLERAGRDSAVDVRVRGACRRRCAQFIRGRAGGAAGAVRDDGAVGILGVGRGRGVHGRAVFAHGRRCRRRRGRLDHVWPFEPGGRRAGIDRALSPARRVVKVLREIAYPAWMLACIGIALVQHDVAWCAAGGLVGLCVRLAAARGSWTASGALGVANQITLFRLAVVAGMPWLFAALPWFGFVALVMALLVLDGVDGWVARSRGEASAFGAALDMETDALTIMLLGLLLFSHHLVGAWVLVAGLWRY